jgi:hypothetical protein
LVLYAFAAVLALLVVVPAHSAQAVPASVEAGIVPAAGQDLGVPPRAVGEGTRSTTSGLPDLATRRTLLLPRAEGDGHGIAAAVQPRMPVLASAAFLARAPPSA